VLALGIETSCDETAVGIVNGDLDVLASTVYTQPQHRKFGGVVPEMAAREHIAKIETTVADSVRSAGIEFKELSLVSATVAPGLMGALMVGLSFAKGLAYSHSLPFVAVDHLDAHILANFIEHKKVHPPLTALVVSGGHTLLLFMDEKGEYSVLGNTLDDAAGEALDKGGKILGLPYPAGKAIEKMAKKGNSNAIPFPRGLAHKDTLNFSFSGLKTALLNYVKPLAPARLEKEKSDILASYQEAVVDALVMKCLLALKKTGSQKLLIAGGVSCNGRLRSVLKDSLPPGIDLYFPAPRYCTDNGAMIAVAGLRQFKKNGPSGWNTGARAVMDFSRVNHGL